MDIKRKLKMFYYASILFLMSMLAVGTVAAMEDEDSDSYSLELWKVVSVDPEMTEAQIQELLTEVYEFRVEASDGEERTVTIGGPGYEWERQEDGNYIGKERIGYDNAFTVTVIELTDHVESSGGWDMTTAQCESHMYVPGAPEEPGQPVVAKIDISKENGRIDIGKISENAEEGEGAKEFYYKITGPGSDGTDSSEGLEESVIPGSWTGSTIIKIPLNGRKSLTGLKPGHYTVEELKAPEGFEVLAEWEVLVEPQTTGVVHIDGESGKITITAPDGNGEDIHYYKIEGPNWDEIIGLSNEETFILENLNHGDYEITEYSYSEKSEFDVVTPETTVSTFSAEKNNSNTNSFTLSVTDSQSTTNPEGVFTVNMPHGGRMRLRKPGNTVEHGERDYTFQITGSNGYQQMVNLQAGTEKMLGETIWLQADTYTVRAVDDVDTGYDLLYSDSSTVKLSREEELFSWVQFTNIYTRETGSYHVIHEYYLKDGDQYTWEGTSAIRTVHGVPLDGTLYTAENVTRMPVHEVYEYQYEHAAYGNVTVLSGLDYGSILGDLPDDMGKENLSSEESLPDDLISSVEETEESNPSFDSEGESDVLFPDGEELSDIQIPQTGGDVPCIETKNVMEEDESLQEESKQEENLQEDSESNKDTSGEDSDEDLDKDSDEDVFDREIPGGEILDESLLCNEAPERDLSEAEVEDGNLPAGSVPDEPVHSQENEEVQGNEGTQENEDIRENEGAQGNEDIRGNEGIPENEGTPENEDIHENEGILGNEDMSKDNVLQTEKIPGKAYDESGIVCSGIGENLAGEEYQYSPEEGKASVIATENGEQIIILRYVRFAKKPAPVTGTYKIVHEYYKRDAKGEHFEGRSEIRNVEGELPLNSEMHYTADGVKRENRFSPDGGTTTYTYMDNGFCYGLLAGDVTPGGEIEGKENYRPDSSMQYVFATESGEQIIILRYYREEEVPHIPDIPKEPESPEKEDNGGKIIRISGADTGDSATIVPWVLLAAISLSGIVALSLFSRYGKRKSNFLSQDFSGTKERLDL